MEKNIPIESRFCHQVDLYCHLLVTLPRMEYMGMGEGMESIPCYNIVQRPKFLKIIVPQMHKPINSWEN